MGLPWARPRRETLLLALVATVALSPLYPVNDGQDVSRLCLTRALVHLKLNADDCLVAPLAVDRSRYGGHLYSDKAPGLSAVEVPSAAAVWLPLPSSWPDESFRLWIVRVASVGLAFLLSAFLVGRVSEGLAPGYGGVSMVGYRARDARRAVRRCELRPRPGRGSRPRRRSCSPGRAGPRSPASPRALRS